MAATPYTLTCTICDANQQNARVLAFAFTDVDQAFGTVSTSGLAYFQMPYRGYIKEMSRTGAITTTNFIKLIARTIDTGNKIIASDLLSSRVPPHLMAMIPLDAGTQWQLQESVA
jgi:hypothetical protein